MTETEKAAIDAMRNSFVYKTLTENYSGIQHVIDQAFKAGFADGALWAFDRVQTADKAAKAKL